MLSVGHTANYAIVVAQLYTKGECRGIHPFIVQLRDENTHEPLPGMSLHIYPFFFCNEKFIYFVFLFLSLLLYLNWSENLYKKFAFVLGIKIGEIGTKLGMNASNNGFLGFENVRIPRENMLMKNSQVMEKVKRHELIV